MSPYARKILTGDEQDFKVRENLARRRAKRQGLMLVKSRSRDPKALDHGLYVLLAGGSARTAEKARIAARVELAAGRGLILAEVEELLS